jgi:hypothetical protein
MAAQPLGLDFQSLGAANLLLSLPASREADQFPDQGRAGVR